MNRNQRALNYIRSKNLLRRGEPITTSSKVSIQYISSEGDDNVMEQCATNAIQNAERLAKRFRIHYNYIITHIDTGFDNQDLEKGLMTFKFVLSPIIKPKPKKKRFRRIQLSGNEMYFMEAY
jgi:hypothetical protein